MLATTHHALTPLARNLRYLIDSEFTRLQGAIARGDEHAAWLHGSRLGLFARWLRERC